MTLPYLGDLTFPEPLRNFEMFQGWNKSHSHICVSFVHAGMAQAGRNCRKKGAAIEPVNITCCYRLSIRDYCFLVNE